MSGTLFLPREKRVSGEKGVRYRFPQLPTFTASYSGFVNGDTQSVLSGAPNLTTTATSSSPAGDYPITAAQGQAGWRRASAALRFRVDQARRSMVKTDASFRS